jgi:hypothetical protein
MKYFITLAILFSVFVYFQISELEYNLNQNIGLVCLMYLTLFLWEYSILNKTYESNFKIRSQRKIIDIYELMYIISWTVLLSIPNYQYKNHILIIVFFWGFPIIDLFMWFVYKTKKPFTIFIKEDELILNTRWIKKRNLTEVTQIKFDLFSKNLKLNFKSKAEISIKTTEYKVEDIKKLLEIMIEKSSHNIFIPQNYKPKTKNSS